MIPEILINKLAAFAPDLINTGYALPETIANLHLGTWARLAGGVIRTLSVLSQNGMDSLSDVLEGLNLPDVDLPEFGLAHCGPDEAKIVGKGATDLFGVVESICDNDKLRPQLPGCGNVYDRNDALDALLEDNHAGISWDNVISDGDPNELSAAEIESWDAIVKARDAAFIEPILPGECVTVDSALKALDTDGGELVLPRGGITINSDLYPPTVTAPITTQPESAPVLCPGNALPFALVGMGGAIKSGLITKGIKQVRGFLHI